MAKVPFVQEYRPDAARLLALLSKRYGRQDWWPADSHFEMMVGSILVQHTAWRNVDVSLRRLKASNLPSQRTLSLMDEEELAELICPSGFMKAKSRALKGLATWLMDQGYDDPDIVPNQDPRLSEDILALPGIGDETADVIRLYAFGQKCFIWDAYALRLMRTLGYRSMKDYSQALRHQDEFIDLDDFSLDDLMEYHGLIVTAGKEAGRIGNWDFLLIEMPTAAGRSA
ncbi:endonuclease III domain-containing protein [Bifidobacterium favimelis]|uniref:DNA repair protein n=1 Tax=Bifidobacterium favimelis TaxID=3122979 RepID=A0ABU8ZPJ0_9BIFI